MKIIFQNENFIAIDKDANVLTVPARTGDKDPRPCLGTDLQKELKTQIFPVHRLDYEVSGLVLYALNEEAHRISNHWFEYKEVTKKYQALTGSQSVQPVSKTEAKILSPSMGEEFEWSCRILKGKKRSFESPHGKPALTKAKVLQIKDQQILWELEPITGRSHQLRYELYRHGFPIIGDALYNSKTSYSKPGIALRSFQIEFKNKREAQNLGLPLLLLSTPL